MAHPRVVHCLHGDYDVLIDRTTKYGNPYYIGRDGTREEVVRLYGIWLNDHPDLVMDALLELSGKVLGCWCAPKLCHGDILARLTDRGSAKP